MLVGILIGAVLLALAVGWDVQRPRRRHAGKHQARDESRGK